MKAHWPTCFIIFFLLSIRSSGQESVVRKDNTPKYSNEFLNIGVDARAFGLGLSMVSHTDDVSSGYWNPAGLTRLTTDHQVSLMHASYFAGIANYDYGAFVTRPDDSSALAISVIRFSVDDIPDTRLLFDGNGAINYDNIRFFSASDYAVLLSYARRLSMLEGIRIGGNVKVIRRIVGDFAGSWGFGLDLGAQTTWRDWNFGLVGKDIFGTFNSWSISGDELATIYGQTGNSLHTSSLEVTLPRLILGVSRRFQLSDKFSLLSTLDIMSTFDGKRNALLKSSLASVDPNAGVEIGFNKAAFLRAGIGQFQQIKDFDGTRSWTFQPNIGVGFRISEVAIDYAFTDIGDQAAGLYSHVFSIKVDFHVEDK